MRDEKEKLDIEDIKGPELEEEIDIDEAVSEDGAEGLESKKLKPTEDVDVRNKKVPEPSQKDSNLEQKASLKTKKNSGKSWLKSLAIVTGVALVVAAAVFGVFYWQKQQIIQNEGQSNTPAKEVATEDLQNKEEGTTTEEILYINSVVGLNLREAPDIKARKLAVIPFAAKITVLEKQTDWVKTSYEGKIGWISADYTQQTDPLVYKDTTYGFGLTFKPDWAGYKFVEYKNSGNATVKTYYVCLPTADKNWDETSVGIPKGYASLFVVGIYTKEEWANMAGGEILPAKLGEGDKYVYTYLPGQAYASDLKNQYDEISQIVKTFEVLK